MNLTLTDLNNCAATNKHDWYAAMCEAATMEDDDHCGRAAAFVDLMAEVRNGGFEQWHANIGRIRVKSTVEFLDDAFEKMRVRLRNPAPDANDELARLVVTGEFDLVFQRLTLIRAVTTIAATTTAVSKLDLLDDVFYNAFSDGMDVDHIAQTLFSVLRIYATGDVDPLYGFRNPAVTGSGMTSYDESVDPGIEKQKS